MIPLDLYLLDTKKDRVYHVREFLTSKRIVKEKTRFFLNKGIIKDPNAFVFNKNKSVQTLAGAVA